MGCKYHGDGARLVELAGETSLTIPDYAASLSYGERVVARGRQAALISIGDATDTAPPIDVFISHANVTQDNELLRELEKHLSPLWRRRAIRYWHRGSPGAEDPAVLEDKLATSQVFLVLLSSEYVATDACYGFELQRALERVRTGHSHIVPVLLRSCDWHSTDLARFEFLPSNGEAVSSSDNRDEAWRHVIVALRSLVEKLRGRARR